MILREQCDTVPNPSGPRPNNSHSPWTVNENVYPHGAAPWEKLRISLNYRLTHSSGGE